MRGLSHLQLDPVAAGQPRWNVHRAWDDLVVHLEPGDTVGFPLTQPGRPGLYTVTTDLPGEFSWETEWLSASGHVVARDHRVAEPFTWPRQTRPFAPCVSRPGRGEPAATPEPAECVRLTARSGCHLRQLEFFAADAATA